MTGPVARNPRAEATERLADGHEARVLEPSPPSNTDPAWYADDPTDPGQARGRLVTPIQGEGLLWEEVVLHRPDLSGYVSEHWLGNLRRLQPLPPGYDETRRALHRLAFFALAPKRHAATGKMGLRYTHRGFGTPFFGEDEQARIEAGTLVHQVGDQVESAPVTTLEEACAFFDIPFRATWFEGFHDPLPPAPPDTPLAVRPEAAGAVADWFGFATHVLEQTRRTTGATDVSRVQLWPEHFDPAVEMGSQERGRRASYGASPGDEQHPEPYVYVAAWGEIDRGDPYWNDTAFNGASLSYQNILESEDQRQAALDFLRRGFDRLSH